MDNFAYYLGYYGMSALLLVCVLAAFFAIGKRIRKMLRSKK